MNRRQRWGWWLLAVAIGMLAMPPLQLLAPRLAARGLVAREASGSLWHGRLRGAGWRGVALGDLGLRLQPLPLLAGTRALQLRSESLSARLLQGRRNGVDGADGRLALGTADMSAGLQAEAEFSGFALVFEGDRCAQAAGRLQVRLSPAGGDRELILLSGTPACADRIGVIELRSQAGGSRVEASMQIDADGRYRLQSLVRDADPVIARALREGGFQQSPGGYSRSIDGTLAR